MHPRPQTAFDVMFAKAEQFIPPAMRKGLGGLVEAGDVASAASTAAERLMVTTVTPFNAQAHRSAVAAFGEFWRVFTELSYGAVPMPTGKTKLIAACGAVVHWATESQQDFSEFAEQVVPMCAEALEEEGN